MKKTKKQKLTKTKVKAEKVTPHILETLVSPAAKMDLLLKTALEGLGNNFVVLLTFSPTTYTLLQNSIVRHFAKNQNISGIYVTINKPFETLKAQFDNENLPTQKIFFVDMVTEMSNGKPTKGAHCTYLKSPTDLTELMECIEELHSKITTKDIFLIIDSVSTLLIYNKAEEVERALHSLLAKTRTCRIKTILLAAESEQQQGVIQTVSQFCDRVFKIS